MSVDRVPVICVAPSTWVGAHIFNPNDWQGQSRGIIQSCMAEFSVLHHCAGQLAAMCQQAHDLCQPQIESLRQNWTSARFDISKGQYFAENPDLHMRVEAFFAGIKSLLDLLIQLLSSERIVSVAIEGFHRTGNVYGGRVLNALQNNAQREKKEEAANLAILLRGHKALWIDEAVSSRDLLTHPKRGSFQLMFQLDLVERDGELECPQVHAPVVGSTPIDEYARRTVEQAQIFASALQDIVRPSYPSSTRAG